MPRLKPLTSLLIQRKLLTSSLLGSLLLAPLVQAAPEGGVVVSGQGNITRVGDTQTNINQQSQNLLMNFDSFDVDADEAVLISQPDSGSWFVGQIVGGSPTNIFGSISANGKVALINPRGVIFGETATINAADIFASSLSIESGSLFDGSAEFGSDGGTGGYVINQGVIEASVGGSVTLLGETVRNSGLIVATLGQVNLASGSRAVVNFGPESLIGIEVTEEVLRNNEGLKSALTNSGEIDAAGGKVVLTSSVSRSLFDYAVNNTGVIKAKSAEYSDGVIRLSGSGSSVLNTGTLDVSSDLAHPAGAIEVRSTGAVKFEGSSRVLARSGQTEGGRIDVSAQRIEIGSETVTDASGQTGGGQITLSATDSIETLKGSVIRADALNIGKGGSVSLEAADVTVAGDISATGGQDGGDGGQIRLTAGDHLAVTGRLDVSAVNGVAGTLTLSAPDIRVDEDGESGISVAAINESSGNLRLQASNSVVVDDLGGSLLAVDGNLDILIDHTQTGIPSELTGFIQVGELDDISANGLITIDVRDSSLDSNALIDIAGKLESRPFPAPLPNDPLSPGNSISLAATNGRIRIRNTATLTALAADGNAGSLLLEASGNPDFNDSGTVFFFGAGDVSNANGVGGHIKLLGEQVGLFGRASLNADGTAGGGQVLVGGNYQGKGEEKNALRTVVAPDASISASATLSGDGGTVIIWSDDYTGFHGAVSARGGENSGDGGFVEVSSKDVLVFNGDVSTGAVNGQGGTLLLDPLNINITDATGTGAQADISGFTGTGTTTISAGLIEDTTSTENAEIILEARNQITIADLADDALTLSADVSLVLRTRNDTGSSDTAVGGISMNVGDSIIAAGNGSVTIEAGYTSLGVVTSGATA
ncbi:MAG: filamentous hemagglutinin N-terminal domain-containing protein, partial [Pseudomonadales bacterium]|nr:filamentous hemagglutinin N-terminal domain-containing protein [Pseudomonadales bacterium]